MPEKLCNAVEAGAIFIQREDCALIFSAPKIGRAIERPIAALNQFSGRLETIAFPPVKLWSTA